MNNYISQVEELYKIASELGDEKSAIAAKFLKQRILNPDSYVVCLGESCSGKSTIINGIIGKDVLPVSAVPSTATITEICFDKEASEDKCYAINKDATMEVIDYNTFKQLALKPDDELERIRYVCHSEADWSGIKIFDTPGYGSLVQEHEEVLMDFLPNSDAILYAVSYKIGIQDQDYVFLQSMSELTRCGIPFCLIINRCPVGVSQNDVRIAEIKKYVTGLLEEKDVPTILIEAINKDSGENESIDTLMIRDFIIGSVRSEERQKDLKEAFRGYVEDLCDMIETNIDRKITCAEMGNEELQSLMEATKLYINSIREAKYQIVVPGFDKLKESFSKHVDYCADCLRKDCIDEVEKQNVFRKEETSVFVGEFLLKQNGRKQAEELQFFLETELTAIDKQVNDYLNKAVVKIKDDLMVRNISNTAIVGFDAMKGAGRTAAERGLLIYLSKFGGKGGANAGIANAASHVLKKVGNMFGKTFSRETHNALKHFISKVGLTSSKAISAAAVLVIDAVVAIVDLTTWKITLTNAIKKAVDSWSKDVKDVTTKDIEKLKSQNLKDLEEIACDLEEALEIEENSDAIDIDILKTKKSIVDGIRRSVI